MTPEQYAEFRKWLDARISALEKQLNKYPDAYQRQHRLEAYKDIEHYLKAHIS